MYISRALACKGFTAPAKRALRVRDSSGSATGAATHSPTARPLSRVAAGRGGTP